MKEIRINRSASEIYTFYMTDGHWLCMDHQRMLSILNYLCMVTVKKDIELYNKLDASIAMIQNCSNDKKRELIKEYFSRR